MADQLEGSFGEHCYLRKTIVQHIKQNRDLYEPFIEDEEPFDDYVERMEDEGTWAGNLELQAASKQLKVNFKIYQAGQPPWIVKNFSTEEAPMLHISYHDGMHYNSVRLIDDYGTGPPEPIPIHSNVGRDWTANDCTDIETDVRRVQDGTGCNDDGVLVAALKKVGGDVDAAIEALIEELHGEEGGGIDIDSEGGANGVGGLVEKGNEESSRLETILPKEDLENESCDIIEHFVKVELEVSRGGKGKRIRLHIYMNQEERETREGGGESNKEKQYTRLSNKSITLTQKKKSSKLKAKDRTENKGASQQFPARNSRCPCGSTKKYKNCCGASKAARTRIQNIDGSGCVEEEDISAAQVSAAMETLYI